MSARGPRGRHGAVCWGSMPAYRVYDFRWSDNQTVPGSCMGFEDLAFWGLAGFRCARNLKRLRHRPYTAETLGRTLYMGIETRDPKLIQVIRRGHIAARTVSQEIPG